MVEVFILSCAEIADGGGIYRFASSHDGALRPQAYLPCQKPMYAVTGGGRLHILLRAPFAKNDDSGYFSCLTDFTDPTAVTDTRGRCACHLATDNGNVYVANYLSGNLTKNGCDIVTHNGRGVNRLRQEMPHPHFVCFSPDRRYVLSCDLGLDTVFVYDRNLFEVARAKVPAGYGVRHLTFSKDGRYFYAVNELVPSVSAFSFTGGTPEYVDTVHLPCTVRGATAAAIRYDAVDSRLYVSVRGEDKIFVLDVDEGRLTLRGGAPCGGRGPRDFDIFGDNIICTNENSDSVTVLDKRDLYALGEMKLRAPLCVLKAGEIYEF